jgi:AraC-like DNA-binding protein
MTITSDLGSWSLPPNRAIWIPEKADQRVRISGHVSMQCLYIDKDWAAQPRDQFCVVNLTPLPRELIKEAAIVLGREGPSPRYDRVLAVMRDRLLTIGQDPFLLPLPTDHRLRSVTDCLLQGDAEHRTMSEWARVAGASVRNLRRLFVKETGMSFVRWRQLARFQEALRLLANRESVTLVASKVGYDSTSAFISAFKKAFGLTPRQYLLNGNVEPGDLSAPRPPA